MPGKRKKPFINKKTEKCVVFTLTPGQTNSELLDPKSRVREQNDCGIYFDDEYNYLQHLKERSAFMGDFTDGVTKLSDFGQQNSDEKIFVLKPEEIPKPKKKTEQLDPEIEEVMAALDDDEAVEEDREDEDIDDAFFSQLLGARSKSPVESKTPNSVIKLSGVECITDHPVQVSDEKDADNNDAENVDFESDEADTDDDEEDEDLDLDLEEDDKDDHHWFSKQRRSDSEHSDTFLDSVTRQYKDMKLGDMKLERLCHMMNSNAVDEEFEDDVSEMDSEKFHSMMEQMKDKEDNVIFKDVIEKPIDREKILSRFEYDSDSGDEKMVEIVKEIDPYRGFDCESFILSRASTSSTRRFAPRQIEILPSQSKQKKSNRKRITDENLQSEECVSESGEPVQKEKCETINRQKTETTEEKKARKQTVKEHQRERRAEKSQKKKIFSQEIQRRKQDGIKTAQAYHGTRIEL